MHEAEKGVCLIRLSNLNLLEYHRTKWMKEEQKEYALVVIENGSYNINVKKKIVHFGK